MENIDDGRSMKGINVRSIIFSFIIHAGILTGILYSSVSRFKDMGSGKDVIEVFYAGGVGNTSFCHCSSQIENVLKKKTNDSIINFTSNKISKDNPLNETSGIENGGSSGGYGGYGAGGEEADPRLVEIWRRINKAKYYPEIAKREGLEGAPKVEFKISIDGKVSETMLINSCGHEILDRAAIETIRRSAPLPFYPKPIIVAVRYSLKD